MSKINAASVRQAAESIATSSARMQPAIAATVRKQVTALAEQLNTQHEWLFANVGHPQYLAFADQWLIDLKHYEAACDALSGVSVNLRLVS